MEITADEYRLLIVVNLTPKPLQKEAVFTGLVTEIHPIGSLFLHLSVNPS